MRWMRYGKRRNSMNATNKSLFVKWQHANLFKNAAIFLVGIVSIMAMLSHPVFAAPCFDNPQSAYNYLLTQEAAQRQARTQTSININRAAEAELVGLDGIGSSKAQAIIL